MVTKMRMRIIAGLALVLISSSCANHGILRHEDYIEKSPEEIRAVLLRYVPIGSTKEKVEEFLRIELKRNFEVLDYAVRIDPQIYVSPIEDGDFTIRSYFESYGWARNFFLAGNFVRALWLFN